ncbi:thiamin biosynthesis protein (thi-4) [Moniliophthora roreri MCA 2997]|uniref:Thiamin biosynthesis protein (Thi-4) n=2 Tax=Moniliophthora roreri TaxID=221103 RepID=V2WYF2_MONRO|nr:thiamin biosynthesis protein (thi-4) [Moniliophthora roreri MCA 2997]KAI3615780.1 thiamine biosynthesis protein (thi-4) [Moniliophthora roreri]
MPNVLHPAVLTIAGSDSSGGAGIQADLKTFCAFGCYGTSAITALTAQNTTGVQDVFPTPASFIEKQIRSVLDDLDIKAIKTGMLFDADNTRAVVRALKAHYTNAGSNTRMPPLVCDPVCVSTSGHTLLHPDAVEVLISELFPLAFLVTPNKAEAELLLLYAKSEAQTCRIEDLESMLGAARDLLSLGPNAVLIKGGHVTAKHGDIQRFARSHPEVLILRDGVLQENMEILNIGKTLDIELVVDLLRDKTGKTTVFVRSRIESTSTHGTGCTLSAAVTAELARGVKLESAVRNAAVFTHHGIETAPKIGKGNGPLNHLHSTSMVYIPRKTTNNPYPFTRMLIQGSSKIWKEFVEHEFVKLLGKGILLKEHFIHFIKQDYIYLRYYARAYGLLITKSSTYSQIASATQTILNILNEIGTHKTFCARFGISEEELETTEEGLATAAYGGYLINVGLEGDAIKLLIAVLACLLGYGEVGLWLKKQEWVKLDSGNPYLQWIEDYSGVMYQNAVRLGLETIEQRVAEDSPSPLRLKEWCEVWKRCTEFEKGFWDAAMDPRSL